MLTATMRALVRTPTSTTHTLSTETGQLGNRIVRNMATSQPCSGSCNKSMKGVIGITAGISFVTGFSVAGGYYINNQKPSQQN
jgi:hypothetical protein